MKRCSKCDIDKNSNCFAINKSRKDGLNGWCKDCQRKYFKDYYKNNKQKCIDAGSNSRNVRKSKMARKKVKIG